MKKDDTLCICNPTGSYNFGKKMTDKTPEPKQLFRLEDLFENNLKKGQQEAKIFVYTVSHHYGSIIKECTSSEEANDFIKDLKEAKYGRRLEVYELTIKRTK